MHTLRQIASEQAIVAELKGTPGVPDLYQQSGFTYSPPWVNPPDNYQGFDQFGVIPTPIIAGDNVVLTRMIPFGWDGIIKGISHNYSGAGFQQGSGGIVWRILIDGRAVKDYDNMLIEFGSVQSPRSLAAGIRVYQGQTIQYIVNILGGGGFIPGGGTQIVVSISGWLYPRALA